MTENIPATMTAFVLEGRGGPDQYPPPAIIGKQVITDNWLRDWNNPLEELHAAQQAFIDNKHSGNIVVTME